MGINGIFYWRESKLLNILNFNGYSRQLGFMRVAILVNSICGSLLDNSIFNLVGSYRYECKNIQKSAVSPQVFKKMLGFQNSRR